MGPESSHVRPHVCRSPLRAGCRAPGVWSAALGPPGATSPCVQLPSRMRRSSQGLCPSALEPSPLNAEPGLEGVFLGIGQSQPPINIPFKVRWVFFFLPELICSRDLFLFKNVPPGELGLLCWEASCWRLLGPQDAGRPGFLSGCVMVVRLEEILSFPINHSP